jgi:exopolysaccharide biosynthesis polyprenyl glycosylphosphotransferase
VLPTSTIIIGIVATLNRFIINRIYHQQESDHHILYLGYSQSATKFVQELKNHAELRNLTMLSAVKPTGLASRIAHVSIDKFYKTLDGNWDSIIIDPEFHPNQEQQALLVRRKLKGKNIGTLADYYEKNWFQVPVYDIGNDWFLQTTGFSVLSNPAAQRIKRLLDIILSLTVLIVSLPIFLFSSLAIKLNSKGPVLFSQKRVGFGGALFTIYKLRTMEESGDETAKWAEANDPRVTRVGGFLRKTRIDELPQAWNVLIGDMSFVGPRPEQPEFTKWLSAEIPFYDLRHQVKPGITGWAQVIFLYGASKEDAIKKLQYELFYIKHQSLFLDLNILVRTLITVFQRSGR